MIKLNQIWTLPKKTNCPELPNLTGVEVYITKDVVERISFLMQRMGSLEWLAYLEGRENNPKLYIITGLYIPEQIVTAGYVDVTGFQSLPDNVLGTIHSHHSMGTFFSSTDELYLEGNHKINIVVAHNGLKASITQQAPCGSKYSQDLTVVMGSKMEHATGKNPYSLPLERIKEKKWDNWHSKKWWQRKSKHLGFHTSTDTDVDADDLMDSDWRAKYGYWDSKKGEWVTPSHSSIDPMSEV